MNDQEINELVRRTGRDRSHLYGPHGIDPMRVESLLDEVGRALIELRDIMVGKGEAGCERL